MIFVPSVGGHSHCELEYSPVEWCWKGANVLLNTLLEIDKLHRLIQIDKWIRSGSFPSVEKMIAAYGVSRRTILRDIEFLRDRYNAPVEYDKIHKV